MKYALKSRRLFQKQSDGSYLEVTEFFDMDGARQFGFYNIAYECMFEVLEKCLEREHNPFELDNQSKLYYEIKKTLDRARK